MKHLCFLLILLCGLTQARDHVYAQDNGGLLRLSNQLPDTKDLRFIESIEITGGFEDAGTVPQGNAVSVPERIKTSPKKSKTDFSIEDASPVQLKYALLMNREVESMSNLPLYGCIDDWWGTRYRYGGNSRKGIDCSAFTGKIFEAVHGLCLPRTAREQYMACARISQDQLQEGDLVFFNTRGGISHVGVYLGDQYFVHASTTQGVVISRLDEDYYRARFMGAGRLETNSVAESQPAEEAE